MPEPFVVLGTYKWSKRRCSIIGKELVAFTKEKGLVPFPAIAGKNNDNAAWSSFEAHAEVRMTAVPGSEGTGWHKDGDNTPGANMDHALVLWSNHSPTEFKVSNEVYQAEPFEVVIARNMDCVHRRPPNVEGKRFSFRQRVIVPAYLT